MRGTADRDAQRLVVEQHFDTERAYVQTASTEVHGLTLGVRHGFRFRAKTDGELGAFCDPIFLLLV